MFQKRLTGERIKGAILSQRAGRIRRLISREEMMTLATAAKIGTLTAVFALSVVSMAIYQREPAAGTERNRLALPAVAPGQVHEMIAAPATVSSTVHYQAAIGLTCDSSSCTGNFNRVAANTQVNITRLSCQLDADAGSIFGLGNMYLLNSAGTLLTPEAVPEDYSSNAGTHVINQAVD